MKNRHKTPEVIYIIYGCSVEHKQVLVGAAAAHVQPAAAIGASLHAGKQLHGFQHIGFAQHGQLFYLCCRNLCHSKFQSFFYPACSSYFHFSKFQSGFQ